MTMPTPPTIALLPWGDVIIDALKLAGVRTVLICISAGVTKPTRYTHKPTGATICVLPTPSVHSLLRKFMVNPHGWRLEEVFRVVTPIRRPFLAVLKDIASYLATPAIALARELRREGCQAILCQEYEYARFDVCVLLGKWLKLPVFASFQGGDFQLSRLEAPLRPHTLKAYAGLIVASQTESKRLQTGYSIPDRKIARIFNPLDISLWQAKSEPNQRLQTRAELGIVPEAVVVVNHGCMEIHRKGLDILLEAWRQVCADRPTQSLNLLLVGTGSDAANLAQCIADLNLTNIVWVNEYVLDRAVLRRYLLAADLYVMSSRHEGFPVAPIEAMACGLPIVATDAPGVPDILAEGEPSARLMVPREDSGALAEAIGRMLDNETLRLQLAQNAQDRAKSYSLTRVGKQLQELLSPD